MLKQIRISPVLFGLANCATSLSAETVPNFDLIGRTLGFDISYDRECKETGLIHESGKLVFLTSYAEALSNFAISLDEQHRRAFLSEFISVSVRPHEDCANSEAELDRYWSALESMGTSKECLIRHLSDSSLPIQCENKN